MGIEDNTKSVQENTAAVEENAKAVENLTEKEKALRDEVTSVKNIMDNHKLSVKDVSNAFSNFTDMVSKSFKGLIDYSTSIKNAGAGNATLTGLNKETANSFAIITTQVIGASKAYDNLTTYNFNPITAQTKKLWEVMAAGQNTVSGVANVGKQMLSSFGIPMDTIEKYLKGKNTIEAVKNVVADQIEKFTHSADVIGKNRDVMLQLAGASGNLGNVMARSGPGLKNINLLVQEQMDRINGATKATNLSKEQILSYYTELGKIPGALNEQIKTTKEAGGTLDGLTARTRLATATGRDSKDVIKDTTQALRTYNITGAEALTFVARMTELSSKFGMEFSDVQGYMQKTAESFKFVGNQAEGSARMFNNLMTAFKQTGLSAQASAKLIGDITDRVGGLTIAQKAFLSSQTGGPGGLVGGFQIEKMLREGKVDEVFEKMRTQMTRQFGRIVSIDEAARSPQAAAQLVRQRAMLQQGPLGQFAKTDAEAQRILDAFAKGQKIDPKELSKGTDLLNKTMTDGKNIQDKNTPIFKGTLDAIEDIRDQGSKVTNDLLENILTVSAGGKAGAEIRRAINAGQREGLAQSQRAIKREHERPHDVGSLNVARDIKHIGRDVRTIPSIATAAGHEIGRMMPRSYDKEGHERALSNLHQKTQEEVNRPKTERDRVASGETLPTLGRARFEQARAVGAVNTPTTTTTGGAPATHRTPAERRSAGPDGNIKIDPITVKVVVDASGVAHVDSTNQVQATMNGNQMGPNSPTRK